VRPWAARAVIFLAVLLAGALIGMIVSHFVRLSIFSGTDRFLGAVFGLLRGMVVVGALVILCHTLQLDGEDWWGRSKLMPYAEHIGNVLRGLVGERKIEIGHPVTTASL
jgi:membrane protein required for colicin V production